MSFWSHALDYRISIITLGFLLVVLGCNKEFMNPGLRIPRVVDLGSCWSGEEVECSFTVENKGSTPVEISRISIEREKLAIDYKPVILPGENQEIRFTIVPESPWTSWEVGSSGERELISNRKREFREVTILTDDPEARSVSVLLAFEIKNSIRVFESPRFGNPVPQTGEKILEYVIVAMDPERTFSVVQTAFPNNRFSADVRKLEKHEKLAFGDCCQYKISVVHQGPAFPRRTNHSGPFRIFTDHPHAPEIRIRLPAVGTPDYIDAGDQNIDFGTVNIFPLTSKGRAAQELWKNERVRWFGIKNHRKDFLLLLDEASIDNSYFESEIHTITRGDEYRIWIRVNTGNREIGDRHAVLTVKTNDPDYPALQYFLRSTTRLAPKSMTQLPNGN